MTAQGYAECVATLLDAAGKWIKARADRGVALCFVDIEALHAKRAGLPDGTSATIIAPLAAVIDEWGADETTRELLRAMDAASAGKATYLQARAALDVVRARALLLSRQPRGLPS